MMTNNFQCDAFVSCEAYFIICMQMLLIRPGNCGVYMRKLLMQAAFCVCSFLLARFLLKSGVFLFSWLSLMKTHRLRILRQTMAENRAVVELTKNRLIFQNGWKLPDCKNWLTSKYSRAGRTRTSKETNSSAWQMFKFTLQAVQSACSLVWLISTFFISMPSKRLPRSN